MSESELNDRKAGPPGTAPCPLCGRSFMAERLEKHLSICNKIKESKKRRKQFDSHKQRADLEKVNGFPVTPPSRQTTASSDDKKSTAATNKTPNWRAKHEEFLRTVRAARGEKVDEPPVGEVGAPRVPVGYIVCDYCGRNFSSKAAERHIEWCREQKARIPRSANNAKALERMKARTKYKPTPNKSSPKSETPPQTTTTTTARTTTTTTNKPRSQPPTPPVNRKTTQAPTPPATRKTTTVRPSPPNSLKMSPKPMPKSTTARTTPSPPMKSKYSNHRINSLSRPKNSSPDSVDHLIKQTEPVMKFKEKFPNHTNATKLDANFIKNGQLRELLKKTEVYNGGPRTVPGVRTGGMSPVKSDSQMGYQNGHYSNGNQLTEEEELMQLKSRIEEMYLNGSTKSKSNGVVINGLTNGRTNHFEANSESTTRGSTSGSSAESSSIHTPPRDARDRANSASDGTRSQASSVNGGGGTGVPKFCHQCGTKYPTTIAKYCYECGSRRLGTVGPFITP